MTVVSVLLSLGLITVGIIIGWIIRTRMPSSWGPYDTLIWAYTARIDSARRKARAALAMWDDGDLSGVRQNLSEIAQLGEDK